MKTPLHPAVEVMQCIEDQWLRNEVRGLRIRKAKRKKRTDLVWSGAIAACTFNEALRHSFHWGLALWLLVGLITARVLVSVWKNLMHRDILTPLHPAVLRMRVRRSWKKTWKIVACVLVPVVTAAFAWRAYAAVRVVRVRR